MGDFAVFGAEADRHRGRHQCKDIRFQPVPQSVGQYREQAFFGGNPLEGDCVAAGFFIIVAALAVTGVDEELIGGQVHGFPGSVAAGPERSRSSA
ncbi:hypothetical protein SDC9_182018 [bioreactor metagenome]|uniref:Uncharacterized protein n=1 Tax=bioreactor metagenome TaxID=1076179 RepID=A0A645HEK1_9ZZZZ